MKALSALLLPVMMWGQASLSRQVVNGIDRAVVLHAIDGAAVTEANPAAPGERLIAQGSAFAEGLRLLVAGELVPATVMDQGNAEFLMPPAAGGSFVEIAVAPEASVRGCEIFSRTLLGARCVPQLSQRRPGPISLAPRPAEPAATVPLASAFDAVQLAAAEVQTLVSNAALAVDAAGLAVAVVDRAGRVLAIFRRPAASDGDVEKALSQARTGAFFSSVATPLSSRTVRAISRPNFPEGIPNQPAGALFGIENTNRGCNYNTTFLPGQLMPRLMNATGTGFGKGIATVPGGLPIFRDGLNVVGGIGVAGAGSDDAAEYAAAVATQASGFFVHLPLQDPGGVYLNGFLLPFVNGGVPAGVRAATAPGGSFQVGPLNGMPAPEGWLVGPLASATLSVNDVQGLVQAAIDTANRTRAQIRLPVGSRARMVISVTDLDGNILALYRMPDSPIFSIDVALTKARNVVYFSGATRNPADLPGVPAGTAITNRSIGFGAQPFFPSGILNSTPGPFADMYAADTANPCTQGRQPANPNQSGIVFFPGSAPLYRNGQLIGGLGVSGDGVEQDDYVTAGGAQNFRAPVGIRADQVILRGVRLPYWSFPRNPEQ